MINEFNGQPFHIALARPSGSFEFTYAEIGLGTTSVTGDMEMAFEDSWAHFCVHHFNQDGLVRERSRLTAWLGVRLRAPAGLLSYVTVMPIPSECSGGPRLGDGACSEATRHGSQYRVRLGRC